MASVSVFDVAKYVLSKQAGPITTMKLQKLCYYSQAWMLAWTGKPLFGEDIEAWANGPVVRSLYVQHRGKYSITEDALPEGDLSKLSTDQKAVIDSVLSAYGDLSATQLSILTHAESPWLMARGGASEGARADARIEHAWMAEYYRNLQASDDAVAPADAGFPAWT